MLATMYSSGSQEDGSDSSENRGEVLERLQRARACVKHSARSTDPFKEGLSEATIVVGNRSLSCSKPRELNTVNSNGPQQSATRRTFPGSSSSQTGTPSTVLQLKHLLALNFLLGEMERKREACQ